MIAPPYLFGSGRRRPSSRMLQTTPGWFGSYIEPFLGGGARAITTMQAHVDAAFVLNSTNPDLLAVWRALQTDAEQLIARIAEHAQQHDRPHFEEVRRASSRAGGPAGAAGHLDLPVIERAARFVYLCGTAEGNGLAGAADDFATARYGRDTVAFDAANLESLGVLLARSDLRLTGQPLFDLVPLVREDDLLYLDPPYADPYADAAARAHSVERGGAVAPTLREVKSFVATVTAKGAAVLLAGHPLDDEQGGAASWTTVSPVAGADDSEPHWGNRLLIRALRE